MTPLISYIYIYIYIYIHKLMTHCLRIYMFQLLPSHKHNYKYKVKNLIFIGNKYWHLNNLIGIRVISNKYWYFNNLIGINRTYLNMEPPEPGRTHPNPPEPGRTHPNPPEPGRNPPEPTRTHPNLTFSALMQYRTPSFYFL